MENKRWLIDVNEVLAKQTAAGIYDADGNQYGCADIVFIEDIINAPTVDAVEVVHGQWEDFCRGKMCCCSVCKGEFDNTCNEIHGEWKFCPNCGAKMNQEVLA